MVKNVIQVGQKYWNKGLKFTKTQILGSQIWPKLEFWQFKEGLFRFGALYLI